MKKKNIYLAIIEFLEHSDEKIFCSISNIQNQQIVKKHVCFMKK